MPKRRHSDDEETDKMRREIRRMEKKLKKRRKRLRRLQSISSDSLDSLPRNIPTPSIQEADVEELLPVYDVPDNIDDNESTTENFFTLPPSPGVTAPDMSAPDVAAHNVSAPAADPACCAPELAVPSTSATVAGTSGNTDNAAEDEVTLDEDILNFLGDVPSKEKKFGPKIQNDIASSWEHVAISGVSKEARKEFQAKYLTPDNCRLIDPPTLNLEVKAALTDTLIKKDTAIQNKQKQISAAVSCIGQALRRALSQDQKDSEIIKMLIDAGRIISDVQHTESIMRRGFIGSCIKKEVKDHLNDTRIAKYLFGEKLAETLKAAKSIHKSGSEIRANMLASRPPLKNKTISRPSNSKPPATSTRPTQAGRRLEEAAPAPVPAVHRRRLPPPPPAPRSHQRPRAPRR